MTKNYTFGKLAQKLVLDHTPVVEINSTVMDTMLPIFGSQALGLPGRFYQPQDGIQAYILPERGVTRITDDTVASGIIIGYAALDDTANNLKGLNNDHIEQASRSLADWMVMTYRSQANLVVEATVARDDHPAKLSPREALFRVVDFRYALHQTVDYVAANRERIEPESVDALVAEFASQTFPRSRSSHPRARLG